MRVISYKGEANWLGLAAAAVFLLVGALVAAVLLVPAILIGGLVLVAVVIWARLRRWMAGVLPDRSGRQNVRVVGRPD